MPPNDDELVSLESARKRLYALAPLEADSRRALSVSGDRVLPHAWEEDPIATNMKIKRKKHMHFAGIFFVFASLFFLLSIGVAGYFFYFGSNSVSIGKIALNIQGPTSIAGGDTVPLVLTLTNRNPIAIQNATIEVVFPDGTRDASNVLKEYPRYSENIGTIASGETVTRNIKAILFGGENKSLTLPVSLSYTTEGSNAVFIKKTVFNFSVASTPLELTVGTIAETVSGKPITFNLTVRSNATTPINNVVLVTVMPFGFSVTHSSIPLSNSSFLLGTLSPGESKNLSFTGTLAGQDSEQRVFHFTVGTAKSSQDQALAITYMTQDATVGITAPFITTTLSINGNSSENAIVPAGSPQNVSITYANTLSTNVNNVNVEVAISGSGVDYNSITTSQGFYRSVDRTVIFSPDKDSTLQSLSPGASGLGTFGFTTLPSGSITGSPTITFTISVSGTRVGQSNVPEVVQSSVTKTAKVVTAIALSSKAIHSSGPIPNSGPIPPTPNTPTTYSIVWSMNNAGSAVADATVSAILPSYVTYTGKVAGSGAFLFDSASKKVTWNVGDLVKGANPQGVFQVSMIPSTSQLGTSPLLTGITSFVGFDRFAGIQVRATASPATTETFSDPGYVSNNGTVR